MNLANNAHILPYTRKCTLKWASRRKGGKKVAHIHTSAVGGVWYVKLVRPNPTEWPCWDGVKQLYVMRQSTEREHLSEHQGEASGCRSITKALHHDKNTAVILVRNKAALFSYSLTRPRGVRGGVGEESLPAVKANSCIKPLAASEPPLEWVQADVNNKGWQCFKYLFKKSTAAAGAMRLKMCDLQRIAFVYTGMLMVIVGG